MSTDKALEQARDALTLDMSINGVKKAFFKQFFPKIKNHEEYVIAMAKVEGLERLYEYPWVTVDENVSEDVGLIAVRKEFI